MSQAVVLLPKNADLDFVFDSAVRPALEQSGFEVLRYSNGAFNFDSFAERAAESDLAIADVTRADNNVLFELGYLVGRGLKSRVILTRDEDDRNLVSPLFVGFELVGWRKSDLEGFREKLQSVVSQFVSNSSLRSAIVLNTNWFSGHASVAQAANRQAGHAGFMEIRSLPTNLTRRFKQTELLKAADSAQIHNFGWPIGIVLHNENAPRPVQDGIKAEVKGIGDSYDYWSLRTTGEYYFLGSLFEDERSKNKLWIDTRIVRVTEALLFLHRLYTHLGFSSEDLIQIQLTHGGLKGRNLGSARPAFWGEHRVSTEDQVSTLLTVRLSELPVRTAEFVHDILAPLFIVFNYFEWPFDRYQREVAAFMAEMSR